MTVLILVFGSLLALPLLPRVAQDPCYHDFSDQEAILGIPHFWNVVSNLPLVIVGVGGLIALRRRCPGLTDRRERLSWVLLFLGCLLTGFGSAWYHLAPTNASLMWDRLPLGVTSIAVLLIVLQETVSLVWFRGLALPLAGFAALATPWWSITETQGDGDLRAYAWCLAAPIIAVLAAVTVLQPRYTRARGHLLAAIAFYVAARVTELLDHEVAALPLIWSGHTWKHLLAAGTIAAFWRWLLVRGPRDDASAWPGAPDSTLRSRLLALLLWGALFYAGASALAAETLLHPKRRAPGPVAEGTIVQEFEVTAADGTRLAGWFMDAPRPRGTIILLHGMGGARRGSSMDGVVVAGYRAVAIDLRAHGASGGSMTTFGEKEALDFEAVLAWVESRWPGEPVGAWGTSLGAAAIACSPRARDLDAIIFESLYATLSDAYDNRLRMHLPAWLTWAGFGIRWCAERRLGFSAEALDLTLRVEGIDGNKVLLVTGEQDRRATPDDSRRLADAMPGSTVVLVPGATHDTLWREGGDDLERTALGFFREHMP